MRPPPIGVRPVSSVLPCDATHPSPALVPTSLPGFPASGTRSSLSAGCARRAPAAGEDDSDRNRLWIQTTRPCGLNVVRSVPPSTSPTSHPPPLLRNRRKHRAAQPSHRAPRRGLSSGSEELPRRARTASQPSTTHHTTRRPPPLPVPPRTVSLHRLPPVTTTGTNSYRLQAQRDPTASSPLASADTIRPPTMLMTTLLRRYLLRGLSSGNGPPYYHRIISLQDAQGTGTLARGGGREGSVAHDLEVL